MKNAQYFGRLTKYLNNPGKYSIPSEGEYYLGLLDTTYKGISRDEAFYMMIRDLEKRPLNKCGHEKWFNPLHRKYTETCPECGLKPHNTISVTIEGQQFASKQQAKETLNLNHNGLEKLLHPEKYVKIELTLQLQPMTPYDITFLDEIKEFLVDNEIPFKTEYDNFCLNFGTPNSFEIEYVNSFAHAMAQPKYGLKGVGMDYFYTQSKKAEEQESFKFWVKDYEWNDSHKREILKSYILHAAGRTPNRVYARDTEVRVFTNKDLKQFQIENCFYGFRAASLCLGLVLKKKVGNLEPGTLLMVTTFGKNFFGKKEGLVEVFRVGTLKNTQVIGGSSKLFKHFIRNHPFLEIGGKPVPYSKVVYYVDYDHGAGKSLSKIGFTFQRDSGGGFMNVNTRTGLASHRKPMQHKQVMEQVARGEVIAVPNAGVKVYEYIVEEPAKLTVPVVESTLEEFL